MDVNNVKSQMRKGMLEYCIMLLLHKEAERSYSDRSGRYTLPVAHSSKE